MSSFIASSALFLPTGPTIALRGSVRGCRRASIEPLRQSTRQSAGSIMGRVHMSQLRAAHDLLYCRP